MVLGGRRCSLWAVRSRFLLRASPAGCGHHFRADWRCGTRSPRANGTAQDLRARGVASRRPCMAYGLLAIAPVLMLMILAGSFLILLLLQIFSKSDRERYTPTSDVLLASQIACNWAAIGQIQAVQCCRHA